MESDLKRLPSGSNLPTTKVEENGARHEVLMSICGEPGGESSSPMAPSSKCLSSSRNLEKPFETACFQSKGLTAQSSEIIRTAGEYHLGTRIKTFPHGNSRSDDNRLKSINNALESTGVTKDK